MSAKSRHERARKRARRARRRGEAARDVSASQKGLSAWFPSLRPEKRVYRPDGSVTLVHERFGLRSEMTFAGGGWLKERK